MGYNLAIGNAVLHWEEDYMRIVVEGVELDEAPSFGEPTDRTNQRWPSYSGWAKACRNLGITDVMMNERNHGSGDCQYKGKHLTPLIETHPGATSVNRGHLGYIEEKVKAYKAAHPDRIAQFPPLKPGVEKSFINGQDDYVDDPRFDGALCRAEWLLFWLKWAVENCERPAFTNS